jgi:hypothetical protein
LLKAPGNQFEVFDQELRHSETPRSIRSLVKSAAARAGWSASEQDPLVGLIISLSAMADDFPDLTIEEFAGEVARAAEMAGHEDLRGPREQWTVLQERLQRLLAPEHPLWLAARASIVLAQRENLYCDAKILTDIRPIFGRTATKEPVAVSVVHTLKLEYHHGGSQDADELFVALDADDLQELRRVLQRAEDKQATLEAVIKRTGIRQLPHRTS